MTELSTEAQITDLQRKVAKLEAAIHILVGRDLDVATLVFSLLSDKKMEADEAMDSIKRSQSELGKLLFDGDD